MNDLIKKLTKISKPVRYINREINSVHKKGDFYKICLCFPDLYEIGMSHLGLKILYESVNHSEKVAAERFFSPWEDAVREFGSNIFVSLESGTPLKNFDMLGFSLQYELSYSNLLFTLKMASVPFFSNERGDTDPIVVAGGPCTYNPSPLSNIVDAFFIGEMDNKLKDVLEELYLIKGSSRKERLYFLNSFDFVYVPSIDKHKKVRRFINMGFHSEKGLTKQIVPLMPITQDRVAVEISRGCTRGCRFCQAGMIYRPVREKNVDKIISDGVGLLESSGYKEISLMSLSASDYTKINSLMGTFSELVREDKISLSLPSLRADQIDDFMFESLAKVRKSGFTIAPEAGSQRMRDVINKDLTEDEIYRAIEKAALNGWTSAKLYFMVGLPFETDNDVLEIAELVARLKRRLKGKGHIDITVSVSNFVPKVFTPFQWHPQNNLQELMRKHSLLKDALRKYKFNFKFHDIRQSLLEGAFSRGDERLNNVLVMAAEKEFMFDGWSEYFNYEKWEDIFSACGITVEEIACKKYQYGDLLPWDNIDTYIKKDFLWEEFKKSSDEAKTQDCKISNCSGCGVCDFHEVQNIIAEDTIPSLKKESKVIKEASYELVFEKKGYASLLSAIELSRVFHHAFEIACIKLSFSKGFNPQPKINYVYPLPVGVEGENEIMVFISNKLDNIPLFTAKINSILPEGLKVNAINEIEKFDQQEAEVFYRLEKNDFNFLKEAFAEDRCYYYKKSKSGDVKRIDIKDFNVHFDDNKCMVTLQIDNKGGYNLLEFFKFWNYNDYIITRSHIKLKGIRYV